MNFSEMITKLANESNTTPEKVYAEMQKAIDIAWSTPNKKQSELFPNGKPTVEEFIAKAAHNLT